MKSTNLELFVTQLAKNWVMSPTSYDILIRLIVFYSNEASHWCVDNQYLAGGEVIIDFT